MVTALLFQILWRTPLYLILSSAEGPSMLHALEVIGCKRNWRNLAWYFVYYVKGLTRPPPFLYIQIITPFLNSIIPTKQERCWILVNYSYFFFYCRISFLWIMELEGRNRFILPKKLIDNKNLIT